MRGVKEESGIARYLLENCPVLGPALRARRGWSEDEEEADERGRKSLIHILKVAVPAVALLSIAANTYIFYDLGKVKLGKTYSYAESHKQIGERFFIRFFTTEYGQRRGYSLRINNKNEPFLEKVHVIDENGAATTARVRDSITLSAPTPEGATFQRNVLPGDPEYNKAINLLQGAVKRKPELRKYCPKEYLP